MRYERRKDVVRYKGHAKALQTLGWWCTACPEGVLDGAALQARERVFLKLRAEVEGVLSPAEVTAVRKQLGISQRKAGEWLGGGPRAFQKYERGTTAVSVPMSNLLRLLAHDPARIRELMPKTATERR
jgi:HTH-type transcriptional regulator/antitoxin MqsA